MPDGSNVSADTKLDWLRQYANQKRLCDSENGVLRNIVSRAKSEGVNIKAMKATHKAMRLEPEDVVSDLRDEIEFLSLRKIPITPGALFGGWASPPTEKSRMSDDIWTAEDIGYRSGRSGAAVDECPYDAGSELFAAWRSFWLKGQAAIARELGQDAKQASTARARPSASAANGAAKNGAAKTAKKATGKRRGRPPGSGKQKRIAGPTTGERAPIH